MKNNEFIIGFFVGALFVLFALALSSCKTITKIEERIVYRDSVQIEKEYLRDSIYFHDSITMMEKGDTFFFEKYRIVYKDRYLNKTDTIYLTKEKIEKDTETITKKVTPKWCWWLLLICIGYVTYKILKRRFKLS